MMNKVLWMTVAWSMLNAVLSISADEASVRQEWLKNFTRIQNPYRYFKPEDWSVDVIFFDFMGGCGVHTALIASPDQRYSDGNRWCPVRFDASGQPTVGTNLSRDGDGDIHCRAVALYRVVKNGMPDIMVGRDVGVGRYDPDGKYRVRHEDVQIDISSAVRFSLRRIDKGLESFVSDSAFVRLDRICPESYSGFEMKRQPWFWYGLAPVPPERLRPGGGIVRPTAFGSFARHYRQEVRRRLRVDRPVTVYAVFLDADNDGDADFYVSSDVEAVSGGRFRWSLFLNDAGRFERASGTVWFNRKPGHCVEALEPEAIAGRAAFHRIVWHGDNVTPAIVLLEDMDGGVHSHSYMRYVPPEERAAKDRGTDDWKGRVKDRLGFLPPFDLREAVSRPDFARLERLPCADFPELDAAPATPQRKLSGQ